MSKETVTKTAEVLGKSDYFVFLKAYEYDVGKAAAAYELYDKNHYVTHEVERFCKKILQQQLPLF